ncbi:hypothetical protein LDENG_00039930 [Lucifuga dentata]|nr:hypothetical protein LDENG_00039930 [Lucifuga dentata]
MAALHEKFGQPHQLALKKIASVLEAPDVRRGDTVAFQKFALQVQSLVGLLETLGSEGRIELQCGSHVARLLSKLPPEQRAEFCRHISEHYPSQCNTVARLTTDQLKEWIQVNKCWHCARAHQAAQCNLKKPCNLCQVHLQCQGHTLDTFAVLDDGSERTMMLPAAAKFLGIQGPSEELTLRTVRHDIQVLQGSSVSFRVSPSTKPQISYQIEKAFTAEHLNLAQQSYHLDHLQKKYKHLRGLPVMPLKDVQPLLLIGSDQPHLITPTEPVRLGPPGGPATVHTRLGWTLQGPAQFTGRPNISQQCLLTTNISQSEELLMHVQRL